MKRVQIMSPEELEVMYGERPDVQLSSSLRIGNEDYIELENITEIYQYLFLVNFERFIISKDTNSLHGLKHKIEEYNKAFQEGKI